MKEPVRETSIVGQLILLGLTLISLVVAVGLSIGIAEPNEVTFSLIESCTQCYQLGFGFQALTHCAPRVLPLIKRLASVLSG